MHVCTCGCTSDRHPDRYVHFHRATIALQVPINDVAIYRRACTDATALPPHLRRGRSNALLALRGKGHFRASLRQLLLHELPAGTVGDVNLVHVWADRFAPYALAFALELDKFIAMDIRVRVSLVGWND